MKTPVRYIRQNIWGNIKGYEGRKRVEDFGTDQHSAEQWLGIRNECGEKIREPKKGEIR